MLNRQLHPHLDTVFVADLTTAGIDGLYSHLLARGGVSGQALKPGTVKRVHVVLSSALAQAMRWGWIWDNPAERAHRITVVSREPEPPSPEELVVLLEHLRVREPEFYVFVMLAATTGARRAQLLGLRWRNIDLQLGQVAFTNGWVEGPAGPVLAETKTKRRHTVELDETTTGVLTGYCNGRGSSVDRDRFVFATDAGVTWKPNWVTKAFQRHLVAAGLRPFRLHDLRHFMATESCTPECLYRLCHDASITGGSPPLSTSMHTSRQQATDSPQMSFKAFCVHAPTARRARNGKALDVLQQWLNYAHVVTTDLCVDLRLDTLGRVGTAMADGVRRQILVRLIEGSAYPAELADEMGESRANISNHLACLRGCGLVRATREGRQMRYDLADRRLARALELLGEITLVVEPGHADLDGRT